MKAIKIILFATVVLASSCAEKAKTPVIPTPAPAAPMVGADTDEHGCKGSAGYTWSAVKGECIRIFETGIRLDAMGEGVDKTTSAFVVFKSADDDKQAEIFLPNQKNTILMAKKAGENAGEWAADGFVLSQWKGMYTLEKDKKSIYQGPAVR